MGFPVNQTFFAIKIRIIFNNRIFSFRLGEDNFHKVRYGQRQEKLLKNNFHQRRKTLWEIQWDRAINQFMFEMAVV